MIGDGIGGYNIVERLGIGGFATTYLAVDAYGGQVALKVLHQPDDPVARERFRRELDSTRRMNSQLVARMIDYDLEGKSPWIAFAYIPGRDLTEVLYDAPLSPSRVAHLGLQLVRAVCDLSDQGLVHRDLKPANVRVGANDSVTVVDLGIAWREEMSTLTANGAIGTLEYMAPETMVDADPTSAQDVWAFGLMLAKLAGGRHPYGFAMQNTARFISALTNEEPDLRGVPWPWREVCGVCLQFAPKNRPAPHELRSVLEACADLLELHPGLPDMPPHERDDFLRRIPAWSRGEELRSQPLSWYRTGVLLSESPKARFWSLIRLANAHERAQDLSTAEATVRRIEGLWGTGALCALQEDEMNAEDASGAQWDLLDDPAALRALVRVQVKAGHLPAAEATIARIQDSSFLRDTGLQALAEVQAQSGEFSAAQATIERMQDFFPKDDALKLLAEAQAGAGEFSAAQATIECMRPSTRSDSARRVLAEAQADAGDMLGAAATIGRMSNPHGAYALSALAAAQARAGDFAATQATIERMETHSTHRDFALEALARAQARAGDFAATQATIERIQRSSTGSFAMGALAAAQVRAGDLADAQATIDRMEPSSGRRDLALGALAAAQARAGNFAAAQASIERIYRSRSIKNALTALADAQTDAGDLSGAQATLQGFEALWKSGVLKVLAEVQLNAGDLPAAQATIDRMPNSFDKDTALKWLASVLERDGNFAAAQATIERMTDLSDKHFALAHLEESAVAHAMGNEAVEQAEAGNITAAEATIRGIKDRHARDKALRAVAVAQGQAGDIPAADATIGRILSRSVRAEALKALAGVQPSRSGPE